MLYTPTPYFKTDDNVIAPQLHNTPERKVQHYYFATWGRDGAIGAPVYVMCTGPRLCFSRYSEHPENLLSTSIPMSTAHSISIRSETSNPIDNDACTLYQQQTRLIYPCPATRSGCHGSDYRRHIIPGPGRRGWWGIGV